MDDIDLVLTIHTTTTNISLNYIHIILMFMQNCSLKNNAVLRNKSDILKEKLQSSDTEKNWNDSYILIH